MSVRHSNNDVYIPTDQKKTNRNVITQATLEKVNLDYTNIYALSILDRQQNCGDGLIDLCLAGFASSYKSKNLTVE